MLSARVPPRWRPNRVARALGRLRARSAALIDLTESNPTRVGLCYPPGILDALADESGLAYDPQPRGLAVAREAVARHLGRQGVRIDPSRVVLSAGTSEAYSRLFPLLCDPGDEVLVPRPGYPLLDHLTRLDGITPRPYPLDYHGTWEIDGDALERCVTPRTRALVVVNPNNPTGSYLSAADRALVRAVCRRHGLALIADEVFLRYALDGEAPARPATRLAPARGRSVVGRMDGVLTFGLGGLSKEVGLPQLKLAWIVVDGPLRAAARALRALEFVSDAYLSVAAPVQLAAGRLLEDGDTVARSIAARVRRNREVLRGRVAEHPAHTLLRIDGGWYAVVQVPATQPEEALVLDLIEHERVVVHPGYLYDFPREAFVVLSLLPAPRPFEDGVARLLTRAAGAAA
ncbi:MAG: pyridoxal phosphate-dependent aminotransferase [Acidobacteria bacterium]|nr:pyridoxal phosphate-dependent aminotransferase [Acidobacteriota bacterium]